MLQIGRQLPDLLSKNKKMKEMCVIPSLQWFFTSRPSSCGIIKVSRLRLWLGAVKSVGQLYGSPTALTSQYLAWDRYCTCVVQTPGVKRRIFLEQIRPTRTTRGRPIFDVSTNLLLNSHFVVSRNQTSEHMKKRNQ